jgi:hypothetical protein
MNRPRYYPAGRFSIDEIGRDLFSNRDHQVEIERFQDFHVGEK